MPIVFTLTPPEAEELRRPIKGQGGFQTLFRALQARLQADGDIALTDAQLGRIVRYIGDRPVALETRLDLIFGRSLRAMLSADVAEAGARPDRKAQQHLYDRLSCGRMC